MDPRRERRDPEFRLSRSTSLIIFFLFFPSLSVSLSLSFTSSHGISENVGLSYCLGKERFLEAEKLRYGRACDRSDKREPEIRHLNISTDYCLSC